MKELSNYSYYVQKFRHCLAQGLRNFVNPSVFIGRSKIHASDTDRTTWYSELDEPKFLKTSL